MLHKPLSACDRQSLTKILTRDLVLYFTLRENEHNSFTRTRSNIGFRAGQNEEKSEARVIVRRSGMICAALAEELRDGQPRTTIKNDVPK